MAANNGELPSVTFDSGDNVIQEDPAGGSITLISKMQRIVWKCLIFMHSKLGCEPVHVPAFRHVI